MSMVGYVLGLGDRHPSNLLLDRMSGKILHIDFGDCFEVAMTREKYPEKIPFRLTRMLINAMEVTGIEGTYRCTCESVMGVLRNNKDSLMAVLEAFAYDPLLNWRLVDTAKDKSKKSKTTSAAGEVNPADALDPLAESDDVNADDAAVGSASVRVGSSAAGHSGATRHPPPEVLNKKALDKIHRVRDKLTGRDFDPAICLDVAKQVDNLILQATDNENLCQCFIGWCPFW